MPQHSHHRSKRCGRIISLAGCASILQTTVWVQAASVTRSWIGPGIGSSGGSWNVAGNWSPSGVPGNGDDAILPGTSNSSDTTVTYDYTGPAVSLNDLFVSQSNAITTHSSILTMSANNLTARFEDVGDSINGGGSKARGTINQSGGVNTTGLLELVGGTTDIGNYNLSATGSLHLTTLSIGVEARAITPRRVPVPKKGTSNVVALRVPAPSRK